jgi:transcription initiation factor TFIIIB Brf1 subunit/transcription initiation factor TFIIB
MKCPNCGSENVAEHVKGSEDATCRDCGHTWTPDEN